MSDLPPKVLFYCECDRSQGYHTGILDDDGKSYRCTNNKPSMMSQPVSGRFLWAFCGLVAILSAWLVVAARFGL